jgi:Transposase IS200 like
VPLWTWLKGGGASRLLSEGKGATFSQLQRVRHDRSAGPKQFSPALQRWGIGLEILTKSRRDDTVSHSYSSNRVHVIFSTEGRKQSIANDSQPKLWADMAGIDHNQGFDAMIIGGIRDHVHALLVLPPTLPLQKPFNSSREARASGSMKPVSRLLGKRDTAPSA